MGQWLSERLGQSFVVENKPGAGTNIAVQQVVNSPPDGYTLLFTVSTHAINPSLYKSLPFDFQRDIVPVAGLAELPLVLVVNPQVPAKNVAEFIAYAKANPGKVNIASFGARTISHLVDRALQDIERHRIRARALHAAARRWCPISSPAGPGRRRRAAELAAAHQERLNARARHPVDGAHARAAGRADHGRDSSRASRSPPGPASARRAARRPRSSSGSTARSTRACGPGPAQARSPTSAARRSVRRRPNWRR